METLIKDIQKAKYPFEEYMEYIHSLDYHGTDDDMQENYENWLTEMDGEDYIRHANAFGMLLIMFYEKK